MTELHFAQPQWVHLLWGVLAFVALLAWLERRGGDALDRFMSRDLRQRLFTGPSRGQRGARLLFLAVAGVFLSLALMRPQWGMQLEQSERAGAELMIALDVSRSMLAEDAAPNRLQRAKAEIRDLLELLDGDQIGLIAFAGRASVLSPLTPDFGFLRLALEEAGPGSVSRGGTRLEEPIRKAIAGFGDAGEVSRAIVLITDGEDHDSFPLEAAKAAAERGIRILAVGFGAETGAEIPITDPTTGARSLLRDADGRVIRSRLDGDLLRDMALATSGAYIPAGTGVLDLASIYQRHIAPLTRGQVDGRARVVRNDAFQWAVLLGLLALLAAVMSTSRGRGPDRSPGSEQRRAAKTTTLIIAASFAAWLTLSPSPAQAQQAPTEDEAAASNEAGTGKEDAAGEAPPEDPRSAYNQGINLLQAGDLAAAGRFLESARSGAGSDGELRFRATYNLGWSKVMAADAVLASAPAEALEHLQQAVAWFQDAVALRPGSEDARYNLELVARRALELSDSMSAGDESDLLADLAAVIEQQRSFLGVLREGISAQQAAHGSTISPELRRRFRGLAAHELTVLAEAERLGSSTAQQLQGLQARPQEQRDGLREAQLEAALGHLHRARERIAQTRSRLRRIQGERAYRRAAAALAALKRARDPLVDPAARLDALLADGTEVAQLTGLRASLQAGLGPELPGWLTARYLSEAQQQVHARNGELHQALASGLAGPDPQHSQSHSTPADPAKARQAAQQREALQLAAPLIETAGRHFEAASDALSADRLSPAMDAQRLGLEALTAARERLLDLRGLIELVHTQEQGVASLITPPPAKTDQEDTPSPAADSPTAAEAAALGESLHQRNVDRALRLAQMLSDEMVDSQQAAAGEDGSAGATPPPASGQSEQLERGYELLGQALTSMHAASESFQSKDLPSARSAVQQALPPLSELRRLFFSVLEHLRDTAQRQQGLNDDTEAVAALADPSSPLDDTGKLGPLAHRQTGLAGIATGISEALRNQAQNPPPAQGEGKPPSPPADTERLGKAAELVTSAATVMEAAAKHLGGDPPALDDGRKAQDEALAALAEAIALFQDPGDEEQQQRNQEQQQQADGGGEQQDQPDKNAGQADLAQLLQGVRDREARRREERGRNRARQGYEPVEKDW